MKSSKDWKCVPKCGDGKVKGGEKCDDGGKGGCLLDCSGSDPLYTCTGGDNNTATVCKIALISSQITASNVAGISVSVMQSVSSISSLSKLGS